MFINTYVQVSTTNFSTAAKAVYVRARVKDPVPKNWL